VASERQIAANRRNALQSTGPRTAEGKNRVCANALKHGLSARTHQPRVNPGALQLAALAVGSWAGGAANRHAWAEAHTALRQLEDYRQRLMATTLQRLAMLPAAQAGSLIDQLMMALCRLYRYERRLHAQLRRLENRARSEPEEK
jgi:hypothetical protein